jgi:hypothetical protein
MHFSNLIWDNNILVLFVFQIFVKWALVLFVSLILREEKYLINQEKAVIIFGQNKCCRQSGESYLMKNHKSEDFVWTQHEEKNKKVLDDQIRDRFYDF